MISAWNTNTTLTTDVHTENVTIGQQEEIFCIYIREITGKKKNIEGHFTDKKK